MLSGPWRRGGYASRQRGQALLAVVVLLGVLVFGYFLSQGALIIASANRKYVGVEDQETRIKRALLQFVQINSRLPCPADPSVALGNATAGYPDANSVFPAVTSCTYPGGVVPWKALGLSLDDVTDPWGRFISYRVYDGSIGLTQAGGMNKVDCDSLNNSTIIDIANNKRTGVTISETARSASGLCNPDHNTLATSFTAGKGLTVTDFGTQHTDVAYVLISHGPSGLGGYVPGGASRMTLPGTTAADYNNTQSQQGAVLTSGAYVGFIKMAGSLSTVTAGGADHYDDVVDYLRIDDVARLASMDARDWPESAASAAPIPAFSAATTADMTSTSSATAFHVSMTTTANAAQQFQATAASDGTVDGAVKFGAAAGNYASCLWAPLAVDLYKAPTATVAAASWSANVITFTTSAAHGLAMGNTVIVTGASPSGYNGSYTLTGAPTSTTFTVANTINPGTWVSGGTVKLSSTLIAGTSWSAGVTSYVTGTAHGLAVGDTVQITNAVSDTSNGGSTVDYNGTFTVATVADSTHFTVADSSTHGLWRSSGTVVKGFRRALMASVQAAFNSSNSGGGLVLGFLPTNGTYINASSSSAIALNPVNNIVSASALLGFATVTLSGPPPFQTGAVVTIAGVPVASLLGIPFSLNGTWTVTNVSGNTFKVGGLLSGPLVLFGAGGAVTSSLCGSASSSR
ncbi:MAG TPA: hypothetical protein VN667_18890, partial [Burkholderiales bacterium]|nr:hypothetical protein [Burkholderiales bacterium]